MLDKLLEKKYYPAVYMFVIMFICSSVLVALNLSVKDRIVANQQIALEKAVLQVIPDLEVDKFSNMQIHQKFVEKVELPSGRNGGAYVFKDGDIVIAYAVPLQGQGFWAPIKGFIGVAPDLKTITGISFYEQNETPGLGAEITKDKFKNQFKGKQISETQKPITFRRTGEKLSIHEVEAVTGATQTCTRLEKIINTSIQNWLKNISKKDPLTN